jgi:peroxiredoxin
VSTRRSFFRYLAVNDTSLDRTTTCRRICNAKYWRFEIALPVIETRSPVMVRTPSTMLPLGTKAPDFSLVNVDGRTISLADFKGKPALLVAFICNHCPFVKHIANPLAQLTAEYMAKGAAVVGINSNDAASYPADSPEQMVREAEERGYQFPYLYDDTQDIAKDYQAACTPDFFLFDGNQKLVYRGQFDDSRPDSGIPVTGKDLRAALDAVLAGKKPSENQRPSIGCNIKWRPGNEPDYFG